MELTLEHRVCARRGTASGPSTCSRRSTTTSSRAQHSTLMSPLAWDLAHIGNYEEQWLVRELGGDGLRPDLDDLYDAFRHPRAGRPALPLLSPHDARAYIADVRERALDLVEQADERSFVHRMVIQHEHQHDETMLATIQLSGQKSDSCANSVP